MTPERTVGFRTLGELEEVAARVAAPDVWAYVQGGSGVERTLRANRDAFGHRFLRPRVLRGVDAVDTRTRLLTEEVSAPWYVPPMAYQGDLHPDGELATARAAAAAGVLAVFSTLSSRPLEAIAAAIPRGPRWFQLYLQPEFEASAELVRRAEKAGYSAIVLTVDAPIFAVRDRQLAGGFATDGRRPMGNGPELSTPPRGPISVGPPARMRADSAASWDVVDRLRGETRLPIVIKGILRADDAREAVSRGARAIIVSNHGGRQLDGAVPALDALPEIVSAVGGAAEVYVEGGVRRASDVVIALAMGARAVGIGRPVLWALLAGGEAGVEALLKLLSDEMVNVLALCGCRSITEIGRELLVEPRPGTEGLGLRRP